MNIGNRNFERNAQYFAYSMIIPTEAVGLVERNIKKTAGIRSIKSNTLLNQVVYKIAGNSKDAVVSVAKEMASLVASARKIKDKGLSFGYSMIIPVEAIGLVVGEQGRNIKGLRKIEGITLVETRNVGLNHFSCEITGSMDAINMVAMQIEKQIVIARTRLNNQSRQLHSYMPTRGGRILTPDQVHPDAKKAKKYSKKWEYQQSRIRCARINMKNGK
ncbi:hypothetical protein HDV01_003090 [Terramyces sp. JEL0728]|nr:hypothetical protein HDV01_003090 [Terramyces sp. JEL0728]